MSERPSCEKDFTIDNELGLHLRAAGKFAQTAGQFSCDLWVSKDGVEVNGKSIMGVLSLAAARGSKIKAVVAAVATARKSSCREADRRLPNSRDRNPDRSAGYAPALEFAEYRGCRS